MENVKIIKLVNGDDIVCSFPKKQLEQKSPLIRIVKPLLIKYVPQLTPMGFKDYIPKDKIMTITNASSEMGKSYEHMANSYEQLDVPKKDDKAYTRAHFSKEDNAKINEIFDEIGDDDLNEFKQAFNPIKKKTLH